MNRVSVFFRSVLPSLFFTAIAFPAIAAQTPPPGGPARDFQLPTIERLQLNNGLSVTLVPFGKIPKVTIVTNVQTGNINEGDDTWLADLTGELMKEGTTTRSAELIARQTARMGGQISVSTGLDQTTIGISVLSEYASDAIALVAETVRQPALPQSELERLRSNLIRSRSLALSQPQAIANAAFIELHYPDHAYGRAFPTEEQLQSYTLEQVHHYYEDNFGARRSHVLVAGKFDRDEIVAAIHKNYGDWQAGPQVLDNPPTEIDAFRLKLIDRPDAPQSTVFIGQTVLKVSSPDFRAFSQMQTLLGGYLSSRITSNIREDKGYAYSPRSSLSPQVYSSLWYQVADVTTEHTGAAIIEILAEIEKMRKEPPATEEVINTQNYQTGTFVLSHATPGGLLSRLAFMTLHGLPDEYLSHYLSHINKITPKQHQEMAQKYLPAGRMTVVIVGDLEKIRPQLNKVTALQGAERL